MSKKELDWGAIAGMGFDDKRRKATGSMTGKELFAKCYESMSKQEASIAERQALEPALKQELLKAMVLRTPIRVVAPFANPTETLGGLLQEESGEDDGFYFSKSTSSDPSLRTSTASFQEVMETIPPCELIFKAWDKQLGQFIFKNVSNGKEYAIYDKPKVLFQGNWITNPGYYGLLFNTNLKQNIITE